MPTDTLFSSLAYHSKRICCIIVSYLMVGGVPVAGMVGGGGVPVVGMVGGCSVPVVVVVLWSWWW